MNLKWNPDLHRFEAEFGTDFSEAQPLVKAAGFKTDGPPSWVWYSTKAEPLSKLRTKKPTTLTISPEARASYTRLKEIEDKNDAVKKEMTKAAKELKKKLQGDKQDTMKPDEYFDETLQCICLRVAPKSTACATPFVPPPTPSERCIVCKVALYSYEYEEVKACLWCQKIVLDKSDEIC